MVHTTVLPMPLVTRFMLSTMDMAMNESRPLVGSSQNRMVGLTSSSVAKAKRRLSPPDMPVMSTVPISVSSHFFRFNLQHTHK